MHERGGEGSPVWTVFFQPLPACYASVGAADADSEFGDGHDVRQVLSNVSLGRGAAESEVGAVARNRDVHGAGDVRQGGHEDGVALCARVALVVALPLEAVSGAGEVDLDRKSTRLNSSHIQKSRMPSSA